MTPLQYNIARFMPLVVGLGFASLLFVMWQRKLMKELPFLFRYVALYSLQLISLFVMCEMQMASYEYLYWMISFANTIMSFFVIYEAFVRLLKPYSGVIDLARMLFRWAGCFLILVAAMAAIATTGSQQEKITAAMTTLDRSLLVMESGLLLLLTMFEKRLGISWRSYSVVVTLGLGICAAVDLAVSQLKLRIPAHAFGLEVAGGIVVFACIGYWGFCFVQPEPQRKNVLDSPARLIFQRWNEVLLTTPLVSQPGRLAMATAEVDSFIPSVEKTVERIMSRKMSIN